MQNHHTILGQMLQMFPRYEFEKAVSEARTEYHARGFRSWNHFVSMLFGQLSGQDSLRGIEAGLASQSRRFYHLGITPVHRSTLAYANAHRSHLLFQKLFEAMLSKCQAIAPKHPFRFKNPLYSLDSTLIVLCLTLFDWAQYRTTKGAVKLHVKFNHAGYLPNFVRVSTGRVHDQRVAPWVPFEKGDVVILDRGYGDLAWIRTLYDRGCYFVTRLKKDVAFRVVEHRACGHLPHVLSDQIVQFKGQLSSKKLPYRLRRICVRDPKTGKEIALLTNHLSWSAGTIGSVYKDRWQVEIFFKTLKQQLKVKSFVGTSPNALLSQLWVALIAYLLLSFLKFKSRFGWSLYTLSSILPTNLFVKRPLWDWLNAPFKATGPAPPREKQYELAFA